jgi:hypothetical protein
MYLTSRRNKQSTVAPVRCFCEDVFQLIPKCVLQRAHTTEKNWTVEELQEDADYNRSVCK